MRNGGEGPDIIINQLKSRYNSSFKDLHSYPIDTCFAMITSNDHGIHHTEPLCILHQLKTHNFIVKNQ